MPKNTTKDSSLTFTLGSSRSKQTEYYDFLTDFVAFFTISLDNLNKKTRSTESDKSVKWFANQVLSAYALRGRLYDITFRSDSRAHNDFSETLSRCFALADDLIILEILQNKNDAQLTCLKTSLNGLHNLGRRLETVTKWFKQNSALQQATDELTQRFLIYLQRTVESLHDSIRYHVDLSIELKKVYQEHWDLVFVQDITSEQLWEKIYHEQYPCAEQSENMAQAIANFRDGIYRLRSSIYQKTRTPRYPMNPGVYLDTASHPVAKLIRKFVSTNGTDFATKCDTPPLVIKEAATLTKFLEITKQEIEKAQAPPT